MNSNSSIDNAVTAHTRIVIVYLVVLVAGSLLAALFTYLVWKSGNRLQEAVQADSDARILQIKSTSELAANESREKIASLNRQAEALRLEIEAAKAEAAKANERAGSLEVEKFKQQERTALAERSLLEIKVGLQPRHLDHEAYSVLSHALNAASPKGKVLIEVVSTTPEASDFAFQLQTALAISGWPIEDVFHSVSSNGPEIEGMHLILKSKASEPAGLEMSDAFNVAGISLPIVENSECPAGRLVLRVGRKPRQK